VTDEAEGVWQWLWTTLRASSPVVADLGGSPAVDTRIVESEVTPGVAPVYPIVVISFVGGSDIQPTIGRRRVFSRQTWFVKVVDQNDDPGRAAGIAKHVDQALQGQSGTAVGATVTIYPVRGLSPVRMRERVGDDIYQHLGRYYRIDARAA
jgi:hypothetical protein